MSKRKRDGSWETKKERRRFLTEKNRKRGGLLENVSPILVWPEETWGRIKGLERETEREGQIFVRKRHSAQLVRKCIRWNEVTRDLF